MLLRNEQVGHLEVVAARGAQAADMPDVEHLDVGAREQAEPEFRAAVCGLARTRGVRGDAVAQHPIAVADETAVAPAPGHAIATGRAHRLAGGIQRADQHAHAGREDLARDVLFQGSASWHSRPEPRCTSRRRPGAQFLDHRETRRWRQLRATDRARQPACGTGSRHVQLITRAGAAMDLVRPVAAVLRVIGSSRRAAARRSGLIARPHYPPCQSEHVRRRAERNAYA